MKGQISFNEGQISKNIWETNVESLLKYGQNVIFFLKNSMDVDVT